MWLTRAPTVYRCFFHPGSGSGERRGLWTSDTAVPGVHHERADARRRPGPARPGPAATAVTLQRLEALEGDPRGARHELQQPGPPLLVEGLHRLPEPPDHVAVGPTVLQPRVGLPVVQVDLVKAADDQLRGVKVGHFPDTQHDGVPRLPGSMPQPVKLKKLKLNGSMKTYKTF